MTTLSKVINNVSSKLSFFFLPVRVLPVLIDVFNMNIILSNVDFFIPVKRRNFSSFKARFFSNFMIQTYF